MCEIPLTSHVCLCRAFQVFVAKYFLAFPQDVKFPRGECVRFQRKTAVLLLPAQVYHLSSLVTAAHMVQANGTNPSAFTRLRVRKVSWEDFGGVAVEGGEDRQSRST